MDPISLAVIAAVTAGVTTGLTKAAEEAIGDAYNGLKGLIARKFGAGSPVANAVADVEAHPDSAGRKATLQEEVKAAKADQDPELAAAAQALLAQIKAQPGGEQHILTASGPGAIAAEHIGGSAYGGGNTYTQTATGIGNAQAAGPNSRAEVHNIDSAFYQPGMTVKGNVYQAANDINFTAEAAGKSTAAPHVDADAATSSTENSL